MTGFIKLHRIIKNWEWYKDTNTFRLFTHLLLSANYKDARFMGYDIKRGQLVTGLNSLSLETSLSVRQIRTALDKLKLTNEITIKSTNKFSIVTIVNYSKYQDIGQSSDKQNDNQNDRQVTNERQTDDKRTTTIKEEKEEKEEKEYKEKIYKKENQNFQDDEKKNNPATKKQTQTLTSKPTPSRNLAKQNEEIRQQFEAFWQFYRPVKVMDRDGKENFTPKGSKPVAEKAFYKALKEHSFEQILRGLELYLIECKTTSTFSCQVSTFLNQKRFLIDENQQVILADNIQPKRNIKSW